MTILPRRVFFALAVTLVAALPAHAEDAVNRLGRALLLGEVAVILQDEGLDYGRDLDEDMLGGNGGTHFARQMADIYSTDRMNAVLLAKLGEKMSETEMADSLAFLESPIGARIMRLEVSARRAMSDEEVTEIAKLAYADAVEQDLPRLRMIARFIEMNDLIDHNVAGALSSNYRFFSGLTDGGGEKMSEGEIIDRVWEQEPDMRKDTIDWMNGFLFMAYGPLDDAELQAYLDFCETPAGQSLNRALFAGFDSIYDRIYYEIGMTVARAMQARDL